MRRGVIDIGTNSVKLFVADVRDGEISPHLEPIDKPALAKGFTTQTNFSPDRSGSPSMP